MADESIDLCFAFVVQCGQDLYGCFGISDVLAAFQHGFHCFSRLRCPRTVFYKADGFVFEPALGQIV